MNAEQLYEIVKDWPREAWPEHCYAHDVGAFGKQCIVWNRCSTDDDPECSIIDDHAAALFRDSGMRWLHRQGVPIITGQSAADLFWAATTKQGERWEGADLLLCIGQAIAAIKREMGEQE